MVTVFTDLDGTFLDHHTYSYEKSLPGMKLLNENGIPLVLVSSKTFSEMKILHSELNMSTPFIFENGGGLAIPSPDSSYYDTELMGLSTEELRGKFPLVREALRSECSPVIDMSAGQLKALTGLTYDRIPLVKDRMASFPFIIDNSQDLSIHDLNRVNDELMTKGLMVTRGGRFYHFSSVSATKGKAIAKVRNMMQKKNDSVIKTVGIGDSENDIPMFLVVDHPYLVKKCDGSWIETGLHDIHKTDGIGPDGFTESVREVTKKYQGI